MIIRLLLEDKVIFSNLQVNLLLTRKKIATNALKNTERALEVETKKLPSPVK